MAKVEVKVVVVVMEITAISMVVAAMMA